MPGRDMLAAADSSGFKAAAALTDAYASGWATNAIPVTGINYLALKLDYVYDSATSVEVKMENSPDGSANFRDCYKDTDGTGALDESSMALGASAGVTLVWYVGPYNFVRFAAKRTGGSASDTLAAEHSEV